MCKKYSGLCLYRYYFHGFGRDDLCRKWYCNQFIQSKSHEQLEINFPMICSVVLGWGGLLEEAVLDLEVGLGLGLFFRTKVKIYVLLLLYRKFQGCH